MPESGRPRRDAKRELADVEAVFKALAHETRRHVLTVLHYRGGEMSAGGIAKRFQCSWPTVSRHLKVLEDAELVRVVPRGRERFYELDRERIERVIGGWIGIFRDQPRV